MRNQELHPRTAVINKSQKNKSRKSRTEALAWLAEAFPKAFNNTLAIHPLKSGIMLEILQYADKAAEAGISKSKLREAVVLFTRRVDYLACLKAKETRIDLEGNPVEAVHDADAEKAAQKIKKRIEKTVKNARKNFTAKAGSPIESSYRSSAATNTSRLSSMSANRSDEGFMPVYPQRAPVNSVSGSQAARAADPVIIKHKGTRAFDPDAVARLKEKLGLSRKMEEQQEVG